MSKRTKTNLKTHRCPRCFMGTNRDLCARCGKPTEEIKDLHSKIMQETLE